MPLIWRTLEQNDHRKVRFDNSGTDKWLLLWAAAMVLPIALAGAGCDTADKKKGKGFYIIDLAGRQCALELYQ